ncbi:DUF4176 domain-containing protein [Fictibacillus iocasae]|uniref:DUF4176 domain-containing protein n=1 Tax=Fictibacillus iocasae TaxID=2715437 RepID=A0ABW2NQ29_9BACL
MKQGDINSISINKGEELLPIGTVLLLNGITQPLMVYGRMQQQSENKKVWDYVACPYPQGHLSEETNIFFQHSQIYKLLFKGFETEGETRLKEKLKILSMRK